MIKTLHLKRHLLAAVTGGVFFLLFLLLLSLPLFLSLAAMLAGYGIILFLVKPEVQQIVYIGKSGITDAELAKAVDKGNHILSEMTALKERISSEKVEKIIDRLTDIIQRIFDNFKKDPDDIRSSRQFLTYYLDTSLLLIQRYEDLASHGLTNDEVGSRLENIEDMLIKLVDAFENHLTKLLNNDIITLDSELKVLDQSLASEGLITTKEEGAV